MTVEFDPKKNVANLSKHGLSLSDVDGALDDPLAVTLEDASSQSEQRWITLGTNVFGTLCVVIHTQRRNNIRIVSVRKATTKERRDYEKGI